LEDIKVPTLIWHGKKDSDVPFSQAEQAHKNIAYSELLEDDMAWHIPHLSPNA